LATRLSPPAIFFGNAPFAYGDILVTCLSPLQYFGDVPFASCDISAARLFASCWIYLSWLTSIAPNWGVSKLLLLGFEFSYPGSWGVNKLLFWGLDFPVRVHFSV
jgi:hypothetical protein